MTESDEGNGNSGDNDQPLPGESEEETKVRKRKERLEQNRISARESRKRKKTMIEELQRTVITLSRENKELNERNEQLRRNMMEIATKYPNVVPIHAVMGGAMAPPPAPVQQAPAMADPNNAAAMQFANPAMWGRAPIPMQQAPQQQVQQQQITQQQGDQQQAQQQMQAAPAPVQQMQQMQTIMQQAPATMTMQPAPAPMAMQPAPAPMGMQPMPVVQQQPAPAQQEAAQQQPGV